MDSELSGDIRLGFGQRLRYIWDNTWRNLKSAPSSVKRRPWHIPKAQFSRRVRGTGSPLRILSESFVRLELPNLLSTKKIQVLDIGCGAGHNLSLLDKARFRGKYVGLDVFDRFAPAEGTGFSAEFLLQDVHDGLPGGAFDLIMSNSALEHIPDDLPLADIFNAALTPTGQQVHIVPAPAGLFTYLWHGYRQYSLAAIARRFGNSNVTVFALGGLFSFLLHVVFITVPEVILRTSLRRHARGLYQTLLRTALRLDRILPVLPVGYVVVRKKVDIAPNQHSGDT